MSTKPIAESDKTESGYAHPDYPASLLGFGTPRMLPNSGAWILERAIPGASYSDAMGCYPIFTCQRWSDLGNDMEAIAKDLVCISLVTDPFGEYDADYLRECFPDVSTIFKEHYVTELSRPPNTFVHPHHRRNARQALEEMQVEKCASPEDFLDDWTALYATLVDRHNIKGLLKFSRESFDRQLRVPGIVALRAVRDSATVGMLLWYQQENRAYYHLGAYSPTGYKFRASFALFSYSIEYFAEQGIKWLSLGAGGGTAPATRSGLSRFKEGWATGTRAVYFCGRVFDRDKYQEVIRMQRVAPTEYFPAYRIGEFS